MMKAPPGARSVIAHIFNSSKDAGNRQSRPHADFGQPRQTGFLGDIEFAHDLIYVTALLTKVLATLLNLLHGAAQLLDFIRRLMGEFQDVTDFGKGKSNTTIPENLLQKNPLSFAIKTGPPLTLGLQQSFILIKTQRPRGYPKLTRQIRY